MIVAFLGHRDFSCDEKTYELIRRVIVDNMTKHAQFFFGGYGKFDSICANILCQIKKDYPTIRLCFITPYSFPNYLRKIKETYPFLDEIIYPSIEHVPYKFAILKRNEYMIENCDLLIAGAKFSWGNSTKMLAFAKRKGKKIINICDLI